MRPVPKPTRQPSAASVIVDALRVDGWIPTRADDPYAQAGDTEFFTPRRPARAPGHAPAIVERAGAVVRFVSYDTRGHVLDRAAWDVNTFNAPRVRAYIRQAVADTIEERGNIP